MRLGKGVVRYRHIILILAFLLLIPSFIGMQKTRINYDMLTYLPDSIETMKGQNMLLKDFGKGGFSIVVTENMKSGDQAKLAKDIKKIDHVDSVLNLQDVIDPSVPKSMYPKVVQDNMHNPDASMVVVFFDTSTSAEPTLQAVSQIRKVCGKQAFVSGMSSLVLDLRNICEEEEAKYVGIAVLLSLAAMMVFLDSWTAPFLFLISIGMAILYNLGTNIFLGEISYITKAIAAVLQLAVTMDYSIFLWHSFLEQKEGGKDDNDAMAEAIGATLTSVTGSSVTTIAGFLALCFMTYTMGRDLGIVMAKGVLFGVIASVTVLPCLLLAFRKLLMKTRHRSLIGNMTKFAHGLTAKYAIYITVFAVLLIPAIIGYNNRVVVYDFTKMMASAGAQLDAPFLEANEKLQDDFDIGTTHMIITDSSLSPKDGREMSEQIEDVSGVKNVLGIDALVSPAVPRAFLPEEITSSLTAKGHQLILVNSKYKVSTNECNAQIDQINNIIHKYDKKAYLIGEGPATKDLIKMTDRDFKLVNIISIAAVFVIILLVLKSWVLPFVLVAAIEFAIYLNLGITGFTGLELPFIVPVCISTIQLGSTVDYAILMSTRYKTERMSGKNKRDAIVTAAAASIPSIIVSAAGFFTATFGVAVYSDVSIISTLCSLMARGAMISMLTVIFILPSLLMAFDKLICAGTIGLRKKDLKKNGAAA